MASESQQLRGMRYNPPSQTLRSRAVSDKSSGHPLLSVSTQNGLPRQLLKWLACREFAHQEWCGPWLRLGPIRPRSLGWVEAWSLGVQGANPLSSLLPSLATLKSAPDDADAGRESCISNWGVFRSGALLALVAAKRKNPAQALP
jgi:hypothetical protein